jgi:hypothetical protein
MDNQHQKIKGYRDLSEAEIGLMNSIKLHAEGVGQQIALLDREAGIDKRWLAIAKTDLQKGFMALVRAVAQPTTF